MDSKHRQMLARLVTNLEINRARILANPEPELNRMSREISKLLRVLDDLEYALSPDLVVDVWQKDFSDRIPSPSDLNGEALIRNNAAMKVLRDFNMNGR